MKRWILLGTLATLLACGRSPEPAVPQPVRAPIEPPPTTSLAQPTTATALPAEGLPGETTPAQTTPAQSTPVGVPQLPTLTELADEGTATRAREVLVWRTRGKGHETFWLQQGLDGTRILARRQGLWFAAGLDVWGWHVAERRIPVCDPADCAAEDGACTPVPLGTGPFAGRVEEVELRGLHSGRKVRIGARLPASTAVDAGSPGFVRRLLPLGQTGPRLLVRVRTETLACGAMQARVLQEDFVLLAGTGLLRPWRPSAPLGGVISGHEPEEGEGPLAEDLAPSLRLTADGVWTFAPPLADVGPATATDLPIETPASLHAWARDPPQVVGLPPVPPREAPPSEAAGWSWLDLPAADRASLRQRFAATRSPP